MNSFMMISLLVFMQFPGTDINNKEETIQNIYNELSTENKVLISKTGNFHCVTLDITEAPELNQGAIRVTEVCQREPITELTILDLLREGFEDALELREEIPLAIFY